MFVIRAPFKQRGVLSIVRSLTILMSLRHSAWLSKLLEKKWCLHSVRFLCCQWAKEFNINAWPLAMFGMYILWHFMFERYISCLENVFHDWKICFMIGNYISCLENIFHVSSFVRKSSVVNFTWTDPHWRLLECSIWEMSKIFISSNHPFLGPSFPSISHLVRHSSLLYEIRRMKSSARGFCSASWKTGADCVWRK